VIAQEIVEDLEAALSQFAQVARTLAETRPSAAISPVSTQADPLLVSGATSTPDE